MNAPVSFNAPIFLQASPVSRALWCMTAALCLVGCASESWKGYHGKPFRDSVYQGGPPTIPGRVHCAYYDLRGEGVAYHDTDATNHGSGALNPPNGEYLNEFRMHEGVDISYTKFKGKIDNSPYNVVTPPPGQLYVGWTEPGEWFNLTVNVKRAGCYAVDLLYTSNRGGTISLDRNGKPLTPLINIISTKNDQDPLAWRQWHHWNILGDAAEVDLPKGISVFTVHILTHGNMNLAFRFSLQVASVISRQLNMPVVAKAPEEAKEYFGRFAPFAAGHSSVRPADARAAWLEAGAAGTDRGD